MKDARSPDFELDEKIALHRSQKSVLLTVFNKADLLVDSPIPDNETIFISAKTGLGLDFLSTRLLKLAGWQPSQETPWLARQRHIDALEAAARHLTIAQLHANQDDRILDLFAEELRLSHEQLGSIVGAISADDLLGKIFSSFCIGK